MRCPRLDYERLSYNNHKPESLKVYSPKDPGLQAFHLFAALAECIFVSTSSLIKDKWMIKLQDPFFQTDPENSNSKNNLSTLSDIIQTEPCTAKVWYRLL